MCSFSVQEALRPFPGQGQRLFFCGDISRWGVAAALASAAMVLAGGSCEARAQGPVDAGLRGRVVSFEGHALSGVEIVVQDPEGVAQKLVSARDGSFVALRLAPGEYVVSTRDDSEKVQLYAGELNDVLLRASSAPQIASAISSGAGGKARPSTADVGLLQQAGETYPISAIAELPLPDRTWESAAGIDSTANASVNDAASDGENSTGDSNTGQSVAGNERASDGEAASGTSSAGLAVTGDATTVDGLSSRQNFGAGPRGATQAGVHAGAMFGEGALREFRLLPRTFSAQYGGAGGGVAVVSRGMEHSGSGAWHGGAFVLARESAWAAVNPFSVVTHYHDGVVTNLLVKPQDDRQQFGGQVGWALPQRFLPMRLRRGVQVFASVEEQLNENTIESSPQLASFYQLTANQTALLEVRGVSASATNTALDYLDSLSGPVSELATQTLAFARVDARPAARDHVTLAYIRNRYDAPAGGALGQASASVVARGRGSVGGSATQIDAGTARWLHEFSPRFNHELRAQTAHDLEYETPRAPLSQEPAIGPGGFAPQVTIGPQGFGYGTSANLGRTAYPDERRIELADLMQLALHGHLISVGGEWSRIDDRIASFNNADGSFNYDSASGGTTAGYLGGLVDWITDYTLNVNANPNGGCPSVNATPHYFCFHTFTQSFGPVQTEFVTHELAGFAEDAMRVRLDLTVTLGARYEYTLLPLPQAPNYTLDAALVSVLGSGAGLTEQFPEDRNNAGPRLAIAWSPHLQKGGKRGTPLLTMHAGYGMFFGKVPGATVRSALIDTALPASALSIRIRPTTVSACPQVANQGFGYPCDFVTTPPAAIQQTTQAMVFAKRFRVLQVQRAMFEVEREVGRRASVRAFYSMATAQQLPQSVDVNIAPSPATLRFMVQGGDGHAGIVSGQTFRLPLYTGRLLTQYGPVTEIESNANATYHAGTVEARWRGAAMEVRAGYTFSRAIDYAPQAGATPRTNGQLDPFTDGYDKGLSGLNFPQRFAGDLIYSPHLARGPKALRVALNGVRVTAIANAGSGAPYSYGVYGGSFLSGGGDSVNGSGGATYLPTVGRNTLRLPARSNVDARVSRGFKLSDRVHGEGFVETFNLLNTVGLTRVETRAFLVGTPTVVNGVSGLTPLIFQDAATIATEGLATPAFGTPLSSTGEGRREREVEVGVRLQF